MKFIHKIKKSLLPRALFWSMISLVLFLPILAGADDVGGKTSSGSSKLDNPLGTINSIPKLIEEVAKVVAQIGISVVVIFLIYAGFLYVSARGSEEKINKAHTTFTWTIIGAAVLLGAWVIAAAITATVASLGKSN